MTTGNKAFRSVTLGLQCIAIAAYFITPLVLGGRVGFFWLMLGVLHTLIFVAVFFRDARTRTVLSVFLMIVSILWCLFLFILNGLILALEAGGFGPISSPMLSVYIITSLLAIIFALAAPRRFRKEPEAEEAVQ